MELDRLLPAKRNEEQQQQRDRISAPWLDEVACIESSLAKELCALFPVSAFASGKFLLPPEPPQELAPEFHEAEPLLNESCDEAACQVFKSTEGTRMFCGMYEAQSNHIDLTPQSSQETSPESVFRMNNRFNAGVSTSSVFRILRTKGSPRDDFAGSNEYGTGFVISPLIDSDEELFMFFAVGAGHSFDNVVEGEFFKGCFGFVKDNAEFRKWGFSIDKNLLLHECSERGDVAVFRCFITRDHHSVPNLGFLVPCLGGGAGSYCAAFGYPSINEFIPRAEQDLHNPNSSNLWKLYGEEFESSEQLLTCFQRLLRSCTPGMLFCSPATLEALVPGTYFATLRCTTFHGSSGGPVMPNDVEGLVAMVFKGRKKDSSGKGLLNMGTTLDFPPFVDCYKRHIFPHIPHDLHLQRDTHKFQEWCSLHKIKRRRSLIPSLVNAWSGVRKGARKMLTRLQCGLGFGNFRQPRIWDSSQ